MSNPNNFNQQIIDEFRSNDGKVGGYFANTPILLLTTRGAKSNAPRVSPVAYSRDGDRYVIIASKGGAPTNPAWYHNLVAHPDVTVEVGDATFPARATVAHGAERDRLYAQQAAQMPNFAEYQQKTRRQIPVIILERT